MEYALLFGIFTFVSGTTLAGFLYILRRRQQIDLRLEKGADDDDLPSDRGMLLGDLTPALAAQIPVSESDRTDLQRELRQAGYYRPTAFMEYVALRSVLIFVPLIGGGIMALST